MAQKDKVKELVGRGLHSYHTKALQQMDRIEKKNKEQNHKISILTNELDNDYLTKTEEGSVVSLEHSKEGVVYLDELQGNTLVNYCTDGSKEMTLNGDIDVEGTFVTTTEGVDNGKVDVMCEGSTLVNLVKGGKAEKSFAYDGNSTNVMYSLIKKGVLNQQYTLICKLTNPNSLKLQISIDEGWTVCGSTNLNGFLKINVLPTTIKEFKNGKLMIFIIGEQNGLKISDCMLLEGDWTSREVPSYFEGMKSVGQDDENGHKIEILSKKEHITWEQGTIANANGQNAENTSRIRSKEYFDGNNVEMLNVDFTKYWILYMGYDENKNYVYSSGWLKDSVCPQSYPYIRLVLKKLDETSLKPSDLKENIYFNRNYNKKEILLNEPLVGNDTVKDRVVKIGGKSFIERFWETVTLDGTQEIVKGNWDVPIFSYYVPNTEGEPTNFPNTLICDRIKPQSFNLNDNTHWALYTGKDSIETKRYIRIQIPTSIVVKDDLEGFKTWLRNNPVTIAYRLNTPIYEPLEVEQTLNTYNDVTHISNNSIIPCNMKIQNSGYNAIIKPSTLYTVALDTNKSGTIGMNLGGVKGTTTNNVLKLTTPTTLTDDSLRLYGKGIKGSKVRLLEGDKTNWIPSHFEGMKSSFEDKVQSDGTYKMEILSNDISLFDLHNRNFYIDKTQGASNLTVNGRKIEYDANGNYRYLRYDRFNFVRGKKYTIVIKGNNSRVLYYNNNNLSATGITSDNIKSVTFIAGHNAYTNGIENGERGACKVTIEDVWIYEGDYDESKHTTTKSNKIQFSSIEPLRKWDRFVFKDGQLMIERGSKVITFNGSEPWAFNNTDGTTTNRYFLSNAFLGGTEGQDIGNTLCDKLQTYQWSQTVILGISRNHTSAFVYNKNITNTKDFKEWLSENNLIIVYKLAEPIYEEIPFELQKIILEGYENGTLFFDTNIPPTSTITYAGETPIVKSVKLNKTEVSNNTDDINDNIIPYLMDMDYRVVCLQLESNIEGISMARLFGGTYEMLKRDIQSNRLTKEEYGYRLADYFNAGKLTEQEVRELEDLR